MLEVIESPFRAASPPLARDLHDLHAENPDLTGHLVLPKLVPASALMRSEPGVIVTPVPFRMPG